MIRSLVAVSIALCALFVSAPVTHAAASAQTTLICPYVASAPSPDGRLDDWPALPQIIMANADEWRPAAAQYAEYAGPQDVSAEVRLAWDSKALYLAIEARDDNFIRVRSVSQIDSGDSIVLAVGAEAQEPNQFVVALLTGASLVWRSQPADRAGESRAIGRAILARQQESEWRVVYELAIPWDELSPIRPIPGQEFDLTVSACDDDGGGMKGCLERSARVLFAGESDASPVRPTRTATLMPTFARPDIARFDRKSFFFNGKPAFIYAGSVDYARLPKAAWADRLAALKLAGMNAVDVTVPWSHHEPKAGRTDLADLRDFLNLCKQSGLWVQINLGPYAGGDWEAGGVPGWVLARATAEDEQHSTDAWCRSLLSAVKPYQITDGGPIVTVTIRPLPTTAGAVPAGSLQGLIELARGAGIEVPLLTANAPSARDDTKQSLANLLDTVAFYSPVTAADLLPRLRALVTEEVGPTAVTGMRGSYTDPLAARRSASLVKVAMGAGATAVSVSDFAPGQDVTRVCAPGDPIPGVIDPAGAVTPGYSEVKLIGDSLRLFGPDIAKAVPAEGVVKADDIDARVAARLSDRSAFLFLWDEKGSGQRQIRLTYTAPGTAAALTIPEAGGIALPPGCAKMLVVDVPAGRGTMRYTTSEIAAIHRVGDRTLLVLYGDADTPGEIALRWPGPPLVLGEVTRQRWDAEKNTLVIDYFHAQEDKYLLVDDLQILILSRERAAAAGQVPGYSDAVTLCGGVGVTGGSLGPTAIDATLECREGTTQVTAALPQPPASVTVDGEPVQFQFATPERVLSFPITTPSYEGENRGSSILRLGRVIAGGPPKLVARFDRGWFMPDSEAEDGPSQNVTSIAQAPEALGLTTSSFVRLRTAFEAEAPVHVSIQGSTDSALVFVNGKLVPELSGDAEERGADITPLVTPGANRLDVLVALRPRANGPAGLQKVKRLPEIAISSAQADVPIPTWQVYSGLSGEAEGWAQLDLDTARWHLLRFGAWRAQGRELADATGVGWYRVPFGTPRLGEWRVPYYLTVSIQGAGVLYLNDKRYAECGGSGTYRLALSSPPLQTEAENILAAAVYGLAPDTGIYTVEIAADRRQMARKHAVSIKF